MKRGPTTIKEKLDYIYVCLGMLVLVGTVFFSIIGANVHKIQQQLIMLQPVQMVHLTLV